MEGKRFLALFSIVCMAIVLVMSSCTQPAQAPAATSTPAAKPTTAAPAPATKPAATQAKTVELIYQNPWAPTSRNTIGLSWVLLDLIEQRSGGRIKFKRFSMGDLVKPPDDIPATAKGTLDMINWVGPTYRSLVPEGDLDFMPFNFPSVVEGIYFYQKVPDVLQIYRDAWAKHGIFILGANSTGVQVINTSKPIAKVEDLKGFNMRTGGGIVNDWVKLLGGNPVYLSMADTYTALQRKTIDGQTNNVNAMTDYKFYEVANYALDTAVYSCMGLYGIGMDRWKSLDPELQKIILDSVDYYTSWYVLTIVRTEDKYRDLAKEKGMVWTPLPAAELTKIKELSKPLIADWSKKTPGTARLYELWQQWQTLGAGDYTKMLKW